VHDVSSVLIEAIIPARKMPVNVAHRSCNAFDRTTARPLNKYKQSVPAVTMAGTKTANPAPVMPMAGIGPNPKIKSGDNGTNATAPTNKTTAGNIMFPVPRIALAAPAFSQIKGIPAKTTLEYSNAASNDPPVPPNARYIGRPNANTSPPNSAPIARLRMITCHTNASASALRPAPKARAMADEMPPPSDPAESTCIIIQPGKTSDMPASESMPRRETNQIWISATEDCATIIAVVGAAILSKVGVIRPCSMRSVRASNFLAVSGDSSGLGTGAVRSWTDRCPSG
jgi:hypothetical protein